jgi:hypothetical protein
LLFIGLLIVEHYREIKFLKGKWESNSWNQSEKVILTFTGTSSIYGEIMLLDKNTQNILKEANLSCIKNSIFSPKNHKTFIVTMDNTVISIIRIELHEEYIELYYDCYKFGISIQSLINSFGEIEKKYYKKAK